MARYTDDDNVIDAEFHTPTEAEQDSETDAQSPYEHEFKRKRATRSDKGVRRGPRGTGTGTRRSAKTVTSDQMLSSIGFFAWSGTGWAIGRYAPDPPSGPMSRVMLLQSAYAGDVLRDAFKQTSYYPLVKPWLETVGPWRDLARLIALPVMIGAISFRPQLLSSPPMVTLLTQELVPVMAAAKKRSQEQQKLMEEVDEFSEEAKAEVANALAWLINGEQPESPDGTPTTDPATATA